LVWVCRADVAKTASDTEDLGGKKAPRCGVFFLSDSYEAQAIAGSYRTGSKRVVTTFCAPVDKGKFLSIASVFNDFAVRLVFYCAVAVEDTDKLAFRFVQISMGDRFMRPPRESKTQRRALGKIDNVWPIPNGAPN
jgi:hypothetical protein